MHREPNLVVILLQQKCNHERTEDHRLNLPDHMYSSYGLNNERLCAGSFM